MNNTLAPLPRGALRLIALWTALFSFLAHGYRYLSLSFSADSMLISQLGEEAYQVSLGRFLQPVYWQLRGHITAPLVIGLFATAFLIGSAVIVVSLLRLRRPIHIVLACGVLTANETLAISNATYLPWTDVYMAALFFSLLGVYAFFRIRRGWLLTPLCFLLSLGLYQSYLPTASTMIILVLLLDTLDGTPLRRIWARGLSGCALLVAGLVLYAAVLPLCLRAAGSTASLDYNGVGRVGSLSASQIPSLLTGTYLTPLSVLFGLPRRQPMTWHTPLVPPALNLALLAVLLVLLVIAARRQGILAWGTLVFLLGILPLSVNFIEFIANGLSSGLTIYAYCFFYLIPLSLSARAGTPGRTGQLESVMRGTASLLLILLLALNIRTGNLLAFKRDLEFSANTSAMARVLERAEQTEGYVPGETPVVFIGMLPSSPISMERSGFKQAARAQGMRYTYSSAYETANYWYLRMALGEPIRLVDHEERIRLSFIPEAAELTNFPDEGCCRMIDGYLFFRFNGHMPVPAS